MNAATAEFLFDADRRFWFLEVNTRLQVEHGVTELVSDVDIVREQLWIAAGYPLSERVLAAAAAAARPTRHAIEVRLSAEDPGRSFAPAPGTIGRWEMPSGPGVRVDTAVEDGSRVAPDYDPLIAKVMVVDETRPAAIDRLARALAETTITGIQTTLPFHRFIAADAGFRSGPLSIDWVDGNWAAIGEGLRRSALETARALAAAAIESDVERVRTASARAVQDAGDGWSRAGRAAAVERWPR